MVEGYRNTSSLTDEDKIVIDMITEGCTRLICNISGDDPLKYARARSHHQTKPLAHTFINIHIYDIIQENSIIRPSNIRMNLPENLQGIQDADFFRILKSAVRTNILSKTKIGVNRRRPGHPSTSNIYNKNISGPKSFIHYSPYQKIIEQVLCKAEARSIIWNRLLKAGLLYMFYVAQKMKACYIERENDKEAAWNIIQSTKPPNMPSQSNFEEHFIAQNQLLSQANKNKMREKAEEWTRSFIGRHNTESYIFLYRIGGLYYFAHSN